MTNTLLRYITLPLIFISSAFSSLAFTLDTYATSSVLASGKWVKISVTETGPHFISSSMLRSWGFSDPSSVSVYGYGGARISDHLTRSLYIDDLPPAPFEHTGNGIVFYAQGPESWAHERDDMFTHSLNPYTTRGYYYLTDSAPVSGTMIPTEGSAPRADAATTFIDRLWHETDQTTPGESGHQLVGEDFRFTPNRTFNFNLTGRVDNTEVWMQCDFFAKTTSSPVKINFTANGTPLPTESSDKVSSSSKSWGDMCRISKRFTPNGKTLALGVGISLSGPVRLANLERLTLTYTRHLELPASGILTFTSANPSILLRGAKTETRVWDVTDPVKPIALPLSESTDGSLGWTNDYTGMRTYTAWTTPTALPNPRFVGNVTNQNIHACEVPDMVIVTPSSLLDQSRRVAALHTASPEELNVLVVTDTEIFNEFGSGSPDVNAIRRMLKMFYDRGNDHAAPRKLKYVLLMGGATHDHRRLTAGMSSSAAITLPIWQTDLGLDDSSSYCSDDIIAFLEDNSGLRLGSDRLCVAVGRIPARTHSDATTFVNRLESYIKNPAQGEWRNRLLMFADEGNNGAHMTQTDTMEVRMRANSLAESLTFNKVYIDAYDLRNGTSEEADKKVFSLLDDGVIMFTYIGHGAIDNLSGDGIFTTQKLNNLYLRKPTFFFAATCSFGQFDGLPTCGLESLVLSDNGGAIGAVSAVRPVLISRNGVLAESFGRVAFARDSEGRTLPIGEIMRQSKNLTSDDNIRRYVLFGDPAMRLATPMNNVKITSVDGEEVSSDSRPCLAALSRPVIRGEVCDPSGHRIDNFNGWLSLTLYDAERSFTSQGRGENGTEIVFDEQGERLFTGRTTVNNGIFEITVAMPADISDNYRNATISLFAATDDGLEAAGVCRNIYAYGFDENAVPDNTPPVIEYMYLNHESFKPADVVGNEPVLIARISDDIALNMSNHGIGHQMSIRIDNDINLTDVSSSYTPDEDGSSAGTIFYHLPSLDPGNHTATLKVWDNGGNSTSGSIEFFVNPDLAPKLFDIYSDANPATVEANFYVIHNLPDAMLTVKIEIFDLSGKLVWTSESNRKADMYSSAPVKWNLTNQSGSRVNKGIYLYRATVSAGGKTSTQTKRIAVSPS